MKKLLLIALSLLLFAPPVRAQVTGLSGWTLYIDPGHSRQENMGIHGYSEAEKVLRVSLHLREMLLNETDIDTVYMSRMDDEVLVSLTQRSDHANQLAADFFYSVHSDAGPPAANSTLMLYGGWRENGQTVEKTPAGGRLMGDHLDDILTRAMRIGRRGNYADRTFYQGFPFEHDNKFPFLSVNRRTNMASVLSEAGFHTNPAQNMRNMNDDWKRLEAKAAYWSILRFHGIERPDEVTLAGYVTDLDTGLPINGASVSVGDREYVTDTFETLFHRFTNDPDLLRNGFYYLEDMPDGPLTMAVGAEGYYPAEIEVATIDTFFTFADVQLISSVPPFVVSTQPAEDEVHMAWDNIVINFSRPMDRVSTREAVELEPSTTGRFVWTQTDTRLTFVPDSLEFLTEYVLTIDASATDKHDHQLDGNADGIAGDDFTLAFVTGPPDLDPPAVIAAYPADLDEDVQVDAVIGFEFDKEIDPETVRDDHVAVMLIPHGSMVEGHLVHYVAGGRSALNFFPAERLQENQLYRAILDSGISDTFGNEMEVVTEVTFETTANFYDYTLIDNFEPGSGGVWWEPQQSGSTSGILTHETSREFVTDVVNLTTQSTRSMKLNYGFDPAASTWLIRQYLGGGAPRSVQFTDRNVLQTYVFGDGSGNRFRFSVRDAQNHVEAGPWHTVDWIGWRLVSWDMEHEPPHPSGLAGDGVLDGSMIYDSYQVTWTSGRPNISTLYFDDLRLARVTGVVSAEDPVAGVPDAYMLYQNYPNPFNPATNFRFDLPEPATVSIRVFNILGAEVARLADGVDYSAGHHTLTWNAAESPSGIYFIRMESRAFRHQIKAVLLK